ncbi:ABC transporter permease [Brevibacterium album]|uniref:ABC transporter permease n=1 Tax=Brevibacterium album TaxID=417948 RepID=UPI000403C125|nr:ABC transporter permease [Brevibacterium album]
MSAEPRVNPILNAYGAGLRRGLVSTRIQLTTPGDVLGTVVPIALFVVVLVFLRRLDFDGAVVDVGVMSFPGLIAMSVLFSAVLGIAGVLAMDRTNGALLRAKSVPGGTTGYLVGEIVANALVTIASVIVLLAAGLLLFDGLVFGTPGRWLVFALVLLIGLVATLAIGAVVGAVINSPKNMGLVMLPVMGLISVSGIFYPLVALPVWLQWIAQVFPLYWFGLGMRASLLPDAMAAVEVGGSWRLGWVFAMLLVWAVAGMAAAPRLLSRMARRESGSAVAARRQSIQQAWGV